MNTLRIYLFNRIRVTFDDRQTDIKLTRGIQSLLAYLILQRHSLLPREVLAGMFWGEYSQEKARDNLNTALWRLRSLLEPKGIPPGTFLIGAYSGEVGFNRESQYWLDVEVFEEKIRHITALPFHLAKETDVQDLEDVLRLYNGELLEGFYDDWALRERERLRSLYIKSLRYLLQYRKYHNLYEMALTHGQQILNLDPLREEIHREMMELYMHSGQRAQAARQYEVCRKILAEELGIQPMSETLVLYKQILAETDYRPSPFVTLAPSGIEQVLQQLSQVAQALILAGLQIQQAVRYFEEYTQGQGFTVPSEVPHSQEKLM